MKRRKSRAAPQRRQALPLPRSFRAPTRQLHWLDRHEAERERLDEELRERLEQKPLNQDEEKRTDGRP